MNFLVDESTYKDYSIQNYKLICNDIVNESTYMMILSNFIVYMASIG